MSSLQGVNGLQGAQEGDEIDARELLAHLSRCWCCGKIPLGRAATDPETHCACDLYDELGGMHDGKCSYCAPGVLARKQIARFEILRGRMLARDEQDGRLTEGEPSHRLSISEIDGWIEESRAAAPAHEKEG